ncbi:MAG: hypothetical protein ABDH63_05980 [Candidatus Caldarchaeales archaeon]
MNPREKCPPQTAYLIGALYGLPVTCFRVVEETDAVGMTVWVRAKEIEKRLRRHFDNI